MTSDSEELVRIEVYVPESHLEAVKQAMFAAGAGTGPVPTPAR
jgi:hypothetical protein